MACGLVGVESPAVSLPLLDCGSYILVVVNLDAFILFHIVFLVKVQDVWR